MSWNYLTVYAPGHLDPTDSYGQIACELVRHLSRMGMNVSAVSLGDQIHSNQDSEIFSLLQKPVNISTGGILLGYPTAHYSYGPMANLYPKIALTMFESTKIPQEWVVPLNNCAAVIVPSNFCHDIFRECGVKSPIFVFPLGIDETFVLKERSLDDPFTFLTFLDRGRRKGGFEAFQAFHQEFGDDPNVRLVIKHKETKHKKLHISNPNIKVIYQDMRIHELRDLYYSAHCLVNPNKGEGFGLIPREFAATGGISLTTNWGATSELLNHWGWPIEADVEKADWRGAKNLQGKDLGYWAKPSIDHIQKQMRYAYEERELLLDMAKTKSQFVRRYYTWNFFMACVQQLWKQLVNGYKYGSRTITSESGLQY